MIKRYIKKPVQIEAIQWDGTNTAELMRFSRDIRFIYHDEGKNSISTELYIQTPEGDLYPKIGDYLIKGINGKVYPYARKLFEELYEEVEDIG